MDINQLNSSHFGTEISIRAKIIAKSLPNEDSISVKLMSLSNTSNVIPLFLGGVAPIGTEGAEVSDQPKLITGDYICPKATKKQIYIPYINIKKIVPYKSDEVESDDDDPIQLEEEENKNFFTYENLHDLKFNNGEEFVNCLQKNAYAQGFKLSCKHSKDSAYISIKCYQYNSKNPAYENCPFRLNLQAHSYKQPNQQYEITDSMCLQHSHPCDKFLFCHLILNEETIAIIKTLSECNIDNIKIAEYIEKTKGVYMTTAQIRYILNQEKQKEIVSETDELDAKMKEDHGQKQILQKRS